MGKSQREKGKRGEREAVRLLCSLGLHARRVLNTESDAEAGRADIEVEEWPGIPIDVKRRRTMTVGVLDKVYERFIGTGLAPIVMWRCDGGRRWFFSMPCLLNSERVNLPRVTQGMPLLRISDKQGWLRGRTTVTESRGWVSVVAERGCNGAVLVISRYCWWLTVRVENFVRHGLEVQPPCVT